ncbi:MAG: PRC-barrel domain-containing protein [archaeon]
MSKKVYLENGDYIGKVKDALLRENKIDSLKIELDKKQRFKVKGVIVKYKEVKSIGHIVIVDNKILEKLNI